MLYICMVSNIYIYYIHIYYILNEYKNIQIIINNININFYLYRNIKIK